MKNKKKLFLIIGIAVILLAAVLITFLLLNKDESKPKKKDEPKCENIAGGSYNLIFNTNGGKKIESMKVCIACAPNTYEDLPKAEKEGEVFNGWYYDKNLKNEVSATNSIDIETIAKKDENGCIKGYEDITLYAKWSKEEVKYLEVTFDSNGGSKVNNVKFKCNSDNAATINNLPNPKRDGYTFIAWEDKHENSILNGAEIICNTTLNLKAKWEKNETVNLEPNNNPDPINEP